VLDPDLPVYPSIVHAFQAAVAEHSESLALVCRGRRLTYAQVGRAVAGLTERLTELGVAGQRVAITMPSSIEAVVAVMAVLAAGAQAAPINPFFTLPELEVVLGEAPPAVVITGAEASEKIQALAAPLGITSVLTFGGRGSASLDLDRWLGNDELRSAANTALTPDQPALLIFTGGTTGEPKAVEHSHRSLFVSVLQHCSVWPVQRGRERFLSAAPIFHIWGLSYATFVPLYSRGSLVIVPKYDPDEILRAIEQERISVFGGGPAPVYFGLRQSPRYATTDFSSLKYSLSGGAPCPEELHREWERHTGCPLLEGWGMSEAAPLCLNRPAERTPLSVGRAVAETQVEVVDLESGNRVLDVGESGEVRARGPQVMLGYHGRPDATRAVLRGGWLYTGDIGHLDADGHLFLVDRKKDMIIVGGYNVYPRQVDEVLFKHPKIAEAATVGRPDARLGEALVAFVVLEAGASLSEAEFFEYCTANLVKYRRPVSVSFVASLPRTNARKIDKKALRAWCAESVQAAGGDGNPDDEQQGAHRHEQHG
jgi:long-chain acyl-CoA synthetase